MEVGILFFLRKTFTATEDWWFTIWINYFYLQHSLTLVLQIVVATAFWSSSSDDMSSDSDF